MTRIDQIIADALAQSPDTVVHQLASEIERLRSAIADALRPLYEGGHIWVKPLEDAIRKPPENLFHKNCRTCICWNGDMCELISHVCENGEHWRPSTKFVMVHPEVAALADFAEEMRASASRFSDALVAVRADLAARDAEIAKMQEQFREFAERSESDAMELRKEISDLKRGGVVSARDLDGLWQIVEREREWRLQDSECGGDEIRESVGRLRREWDEATSSLRTIPADRVLGEGEVAIEICERDCREDDDEVLEVLRICGYGQHADMLEVAIKAHEKRAALRANQGGANHD